MSNCPMCTLVYMYIIKRNGVGNRERERDRRYMCVLFSSFLISSRPLSVSMGNAIKWLKFTIANIQPSTPENEVH